MPIVIVAYSGGFGPTLSVLDRGGVGSRVRGIVLLDALYAGIDKFADWIADNRSAFFVSSYTPHTARHNGDLEELLSERVSALRFRTQEQPSARHGYVPADRRYLAPRFCEPRLGRLSDRGYSGENGQLQDRDGRRSVAKTVQRSGVKSQLRRIPADKSEHPACQKLGRLRQFIRSNNCAAPNSLPSSSAELPVKQIWPLLMT